VDHAIVSRINPWLLVALVAAFVLLASAILVAAQPGLLHAIGAALHGAPPMAPMACSAIPLPC
jgi:hypothetical protein